MGTRSPGGISSSWLIIFLYVSLKKKRPGDSQRENILPDPAQNIFNAITIAIEIVIRINRTLLKIFRVDPAEKNLSRLRS